MKKKKELKYLSKLFKKMQRYFKQFLQTKSPEALHGFRVEVKKTKSFLTLLEADKKNDNLLETFKPVKKIFKQTGIIRDAYIHQQQATDNNIDAPQFYKTQDVIQQKEINKLLHHQHQLKQQIKKTKQQLQERVRIVANKKITQFFTRQIDNTAQLLKQHNFSEQLHTGRKMLKHLLYNRKVIPQAVATGMKINFDEIDSMQQAIGDWHDNKLAIDFFTHTLPSQDLSTIKHKQTALKKKITAKAEAFAQNNSL